MPLGLINDGATCYLNSLIQTLFMTPQFRSHVYESFTFDSKRIAQADCIPYQLQKLFAQLQIGEHPVSTRQLRRSFQWDDNQSFEQHDVQQFCRVLFGALEDSSRNAGWIQGLFAGMIGSVLNCGRHQRIREEMFMDLSLPLRKNGPGTFINGLQEALKAYLEPEKLDDKIMCDQCQEKVNVTKGFVLLRLPEILTIQLNRFQLNYESFQRQKMTSFMYYPELLYMEKFFKPHSEIQISSLPLQIIQAHSKQVPIEVKTTSRTQAFYDGEPMAKQTIKRKNSDQNIRVKEDVKFCDDLSYRNKDSFQPVTKQAEKQMNKDILGVLKLQKDVLQAKMERIEKKLVEKAVKESKKEAVASQANQLNAKSAIEDYSCFDNLEDDMLFGSDTSQYNSLWTTGLTAGTQGQSTTSSAAKVYGPSSSKVSVTYNHIEPHYQEGVQYPPHTYMLYAILVHVGSAFGGHYYSYICEGGQWYKFDDQSVVKVERSQIRKYGVGTDSSNHKPMTNTPTAYMLFYRDFAKIKMATSKVIEVPEELIEAVKKQMMEVTKIKDKGVDVSTSNSVYERLKRVKNSVGVHVYVKDQFKTNLIIADRYETTLGELKAQIVSSLSLGQVEHNWRLRRYNKVDKTMHEVFIGNDLTLETSGFRQLMHLAIETKAQQQDFEVYDPLVMVVKVNEWRPNITFLTQNQLTPIRISIRQDEPLAKLRASIAQATKLKSPIILKRNYSVGNPYTVLDNDKMTLIQLRFFNCINVYVQSGQELNVTGDKQSSKLRQFKWLIQFQAEQYKCTIVYNDFRKGDERNQQLVVDTRTALGSLKTRLSTLLDFPKSDFRIKKGRQMPQLTAYSKRLIDLRFSGTQILFLQEGKSSKGVVNLKRGIMTSEPFSIEFTTFEETTVEITADMLTVGDLREALGQKLKIPVEQIRIRQLQGGQFGEIFSNSSQIQRVRQRLLVWQQIPQPTIGLQLYVRVFDVQSMSLSPVKQVYVNSGANYIELCYVLQQATKIPLNHLQCVRLLSAYTDVGSLLGLERTGLLGLDHQIREGPLWIVGDGSVIM